MVKRFRMSLMKMPNLGILKKRYRLWSPRKRGSMFAKSKMRNNRKNLEKGGDPQKLRNPRYKYLSKMRRCSRRYPSHYQSRRSNPKNQSLKIKLRKMESLKWKKAKWKSVKRRNPLPKMTRSWKRRKNLRSSLKILLLLKKKSPNALEAALANKTQFASLTVKGH